MSTRLLAELDPQVAFPGLEGTIRETGVLMIPTGRSDRDLLTAFVQLHWDDADALDRFADRCEELLRARALRDEACALRGQSQQARRKKNQVHAEALELAGLPE